MTELVHVGAHADVLASGHGIGPGDRVDPRDLDLTEGDHFGEDQHLLDEGTLVDVESFGAATSPSRADLRSRAAELEIEGRSKMTTDQLQAAVAAREAEEGVTDAS